MPMSEQERREYREDLARIFDGIDDIREDVRDVKSEVSARVSGKELDEALERHRILCMGGREPTSAYRTNAAAPAESEEVSLSKVFTPAVKKLLVVAAVLGSFIGGLVASGGVQL